MPMHEQILRKEQDPFQKAEDQSATALAQAAAVARQLAEAAVTSLAQPTAHEALAPSVSAHLPAQTGVSEEAVKKLFNHFAERERKGGQSAAEEAQKTSSTQTDPRTSARARDPRGSTSRLAGDEFTDGFAADFMPDSQFVGADLDDRPRVSSEATEAVDVWEGSGRKRRRAAAAAKPATKSKKGKGK